MRSAKYVALFGLILLHTFLFSTTIYGSLYNANDMKKLNQVVVLVEYNNATIFQRVFDKTYSLDLNNGAYTIRAYTYENKTIKYYASYNINVRDKDISLDMLLAPYELYKMMPDFKQPDLPIPEAETNKNGNRTISLLLPLIVFLAILIFGGYVLFTNANEMAKREDKAKRRANMKTADDGKDRDDKTLDEDCLSVIAVLHENGNRMKQKEIRDILNFSESKMSLIITELEVSGYIKKIKRGRQNILKLKKIPKGELPKIRVN